jgi:cell division protein FtsB
MLDFREKSKIRRAIYAKPTIILMLVISLFIANGAWNMYQKSKTSLNNKEATEQELSELQQRKDSLSEDINNLSTDRGIEEEIRERFMVAKEGENVVVVTNPKKEEVHTITVTDDNKPTILDKMLSATGLSN